MFDDLKIRNKLVLLVAGPLVIIVLLAALGARSRQATADESREVAGLVAVAQSNSNVVDALQRESLYGTAFVASDRSTWKAELSAARKATDAALTSALERMKGDARNTSAGFRSASTLAIDAADKLQYIRKAVDQGYRWDQVATTFASLQDTFLSVNDTVAESLTDPQVASQLRTGAALAAYKAAIGRQGAILVGAAEAGGFAEPGSFPLLQDTAADERNQEAILNSIADSGYKGQVRDALTSDARNGLEAARDRALTRGAGAAVTDDPKALVTDTNTILGGLHKVETSLSDSLISASQATRADAERAVELFMVAALVAILVAAAGAVLLGRRITQPLNKLTVAADRLATEQMPRLVESLRNPSEDELAFQLGSLENIEVSSNDEIGRLASSFNDVQRVAGEVAAEQAALLRKGIGEMFVNLARRNQALLDRQIDFIDELERGEEDPDQLENLYRLDHLATRMRRNAESLLVLAGAEPPRRRGRPAPLANVVRAALAEVEDFGRIELLSFDEILIASNAAADLAHLLSELMENATNFSPPETRVEVVGHRTKADGYVISVTDHGIGMSSEQILEANESLAKPPLVGLALSRSLGFIVVGRLSGRHGVAVRMMPSPSGGVTAVVSIPPSLVTDTLGGASSSPPPPAIEAAPRLAPVADAPDMASASASASSSEIAPLEFRPYDHQEPATEAPASLADAVPTGAAFDAGLESLVAPPPPTPITSSRQAVEASPTGPTTSGANGRGANGLPTRRLQPGGVSPAPGDAPMVFEEPAAAATETADRKAPPAPAAPEGLPEPVAFNPPPPAAPAPSGGRLDGPPPAAPSLPARGAAPRPPAAPADPASRPFFLDDAEPPRLFGRTTAEDGPPPAAVPPRLFGAQAPAAPAARPSAPPTPSTPDAASPPLVRRAPAASAPPAAPPAPPAAPAAAPAPVPVGAPAAPGPDGGNGAAPVTTAGLARRTPRQAGGAPRAIPGADVERGVSATRRSPDEVRNLLSRYRDGQQRARTEEPVSAGAPDERDTP